MFRLRHQIGGDANCVAVGTDDDGFGWAGEKFNGAIKGNLFLGCSNIAIARADDLIYARNFFRPVGEGCDGLSSTDSIEFAHAKKRGGGERCLCRARRGNANLADPCNLSRNHRHEYSRRQGIAAARHVTPHRVEWTHQLTDADAGLDFAPPVVEPTPGKEFGLPFRVAANVSGCMFDRGPQLWVCLL